MINSNNENNAKTWCKRAEELAAWTWLRLVNRVDVWGAYWHDDRGTHSFTKPKPGQRGLFLLNEAKLIRHFSAQDCTELVGLHSTSPQGTSLWGSLDIDWHGEFSSSPELNWAAARCWYDQLRTLSFRPLLTDSNGKGGFHLDILFDEPVPTAKAYAFLGWLARDHAKHGLPAVPECFPKQPHLKAGQVGNWLRVFGKHHSRDHWSKVWNGERWLGGDEAIDFILAIQGDSPTVMPEEVKPEEPKAACPPRTISRPQTGTELARRIARYLVKLPNLGEGQGRDKVAYSFAAFLVRDLELSDEAALPWLVKWDDNNCPPKGEARLREIMKNVHAYGQRSYGCGRSWQDDAVSFAVEVS